jgi:hypothetical protein
MRFLFRIIFWLGVVLVFLPRGGQPNASDGGLSAGEAMSAAKATVTDMRSFCGRQPEACATGSHVAVALGQRAQSGAKLIYDYLTEYLGPSAREAGNSERGSVVARHASNPGRDTLMPSDLALPWRGPRPRREAQLAHTN